MKTRQDLIKRTLELLNAIGAGQSPAAEDAQAIDDVIDGKLKELNRRRVMYFDDVNNFDEELIDPVATIIGDMVAPDFGQARDPVRVMTAMNVLREMRDSDWSPNDVTPSLYY